MVDHHVQNQEFIKSLGELILVNIGNENFGPRELAAAVGMRQRKLSIILRRITKKSVCQFICEVRLNKALAMLKNEDVTASEVAYKVGFGSPTYFNKCFHEYYGFPPGKIRKEVFDNNDGAIPVRKILGNIHLKSFWRIGINTFSGLLVIALAAFIISYTLSRNLSGNNPSKGSKNIEKSIAVLPFTTLSDSLDTQYFVDGLMDEILSDLSKIHDLRVISRISVEQFRKNKKTASEVARKLNVEYIVTGSGQKLENSYQLRVQLTEARNNKQIWAETYGKEVKNIKGIYEIQSEIAQTIASELKAKITPEEKQLIEQKPTEDLAAYDYFLRGRAELNNYWSDPIDINNKRALDRSEELFKKALVHDSGYALVYTGLANVYLSKHGNDSFLSMNYLDTMLIYIDRALKYDDHLAEAYLSRGYFYNFNGQGELSIKETKKAIKYDPTLTEAYKSLSYMYLEDLHSADYVKALEYANKALDLLSGVEKSTFLYHMGSFYSDFAGFPDVAKQYIQVAFKTDNNPGRYSFMLSGIEVNSGNFENALELIKQACEPDSSKVEYLLFMGYIDYLTNRYKESLDCLRKAEKSLEAATPFNSSSPISFNEIAYVFLMNGYKREADKWFDRQKKFSEVSIKFGRRNRNTGRDYYDLASLYAFHGDKKQAFENLREFGKIKICPWYMLCDIKSNPFFQDIRNEPEFKNIVSGLEATYKSEHERVRKWIEQQKR